MGGPIVAAFVSTGRCGTRRLAAGMRAIYPGVTVAHAPIGAAYAPRRYFRRYDDPDAILAVDEVSRHIGRIGGCGRPYVETGWPLLAAIPLLAARFAERLRVVHLTRHPVPSALSHLAAGTYAGSGRDDAYTRLATLGPRDPNVCQPEYAATWDQLSPYEKCLFWWTEVNLFGLELPGRFPGIPFLRVTSERLLAGERAELERLLAFMELPWDERWREHARRTADRWHHHADRDVDPLDRSGRVS